MKPKRYPIALNLPAIVALLIIFARHVVQAMLNSSWFPTPSPALPVVIANIDALEASEVAVHARTKGAAAARDVKWKAVVDDLMALKTYVSTIVSQNLVHAAAIIEAAGMSQKRFSPRKKAALAALMGLTPGQVLLRAKAVRRGAVYEWLYSGDGGKTWIALAMTNVAHTSLPGTTAGTTYLFKCRTTVKNVTSDWSQTISFLTH